MIGRLSEFPYGTAPLCILVLAILSGGAIFLLDGPASEHEADLTFAVFADTHYQAYQQIIPEFEREHGVKVQIEKVQIQSLQHRLAAALLSGAEAPDVVELVVGSMGFFTKGPIEDVGFLDLTERIEAEGLDKRIVSSRFSLWSSRGHVFGLPHDVHPVVLAYNNDVITKLGVDIESIETWDDFVEVAQEITTDIDNDGTIDRYAIDMFADGGDHLDLLIRQRGGSLFDEQGRLTMYDPIIVDTLIWYVKQTRGNTRVSFPAGWGQNLARAMLDDFVVFYFTPDWRTKNFENEIPKMAGRLRLMPLPAWEKGGRRTSTWGGTGMCITKSCKNPDLAWEFAKFLYFHREGLGRGYNKTGVLPPLRDAWDIPELHEPNGFYGGQVVGELMAELAPDAPPTYMTPYFTDALWKLNETFIDACEYYEKNGEDGLPERVDATLKKKTAAIQKLIDYNAFYSSAGQKED